MYAIRSYYGFNNRNNDRQMYPAVCGKCGRDCQVPFQPTGAKEVLCVITSYSIHYTKLYETIWSEVDKLVESLAKSESGANGQPMFSSGFNRVIQTAVDESKKLGDEYVSQEMLLLGILKSGSNEVKRILTESGVSEENLIEAIKNLRGGNPVNSESSETTYKALEKYTVDLTALAEKGKIDPVIGREEEIRRVMQVLSRRIV